MTTSYPGALDNFAESSPATLSADDSTGRTHSERHNDVESAVEAVQTELGTDPAGTFTTVKARLDFADPTIVLNAGEALPAGTPEGTVVLRRSAAGGGGDHGALQGLADNDHPQYVQRMSAFPVKSGGVGSDEWSLPPGVTATGTMATLTVSAGTIWYCPFIVDEPITITAAAVRTTTGAASSIARVGIFTADSSWQPASLVAELSTFDTSGVAVVTQTGLSHALSKGRHLIGLRTEGGNPTLAHQGGNGIATSPISGLNPTLGSGGYTQQGMFVSSASAFSTLPAFTGFGQYNSFAFFRWSIT